MIGLYSRAYLDTRDESPYGSDVGDLFELPLTTTRRPGKGASDERHRRIHRTGHHGYADDSQPRQGRGAARRARRQPGCGRCRRQARRRHGGRVGRGSREPGGRALHLSAQRRHRARGLSGARRCGSRREGRPGHLRLLDREPRGDARGQPRARRQEHHAHGHADVGLAAPGGFRRHLLHRGRRQGHARPDQALPRDHGQAAHVRGRLRHGQSRQAHSQWPGRRDLGRRRRGSGSVRAERGRPLHLLRRGPQRWRHGLRT